MHDTAVISEATQSLEPQPLIDSRPRRASFLILLVILVLGGAVRLILWNSFDRVTLHDDERDYSTIAVNLLQHGEFAIFPGTSVSTRPPLYPAMLAGLYRFFGVENYEAVRLVQAGLSLATVLLVYALTLEMFPRRVALCAAALFAFYPSMLGFNNLLYAETLFVFLLCAGSYLLIRSVRTESMWMLAAAAMVLALGALTRSVLWTFPIPFAMYLLCVWNGNWRRRSLAALVMAATFGLTLTPWAVRCSRLEETFIPVDTLGGRNFYMGNYAHTPMFRAWDAISLRGKQAWYHEFHQNFPPSTWDTQGKLDKLAFREGVRFALRHPGLTIRRDLVKTFQFWGLERELVGGVAHGYYGQFSSLQIASITLLVFGSYALLVTMAIFGLIMFPPVDRRSMWYLLLVIGFMWAIHSVVFSHSRYHLPAMVLLLPFSARALESAKALCQRRGQPRFWIACSISGLLMAGWIWEIAFENRDRFLSLVHFS